jgi:GNAT superfamily N-acetyltransferase
MQAKHQIKKITAPETLPLRQKVLKPFLSLDECIMPGDELKTTVHWGFFLQNTLVSVATIMFEKHPDFSFEKSFRLRGMATDLSLAGQGLGSRLLKVAEDDLIKQGIEFLWFNARIKAFPFYERLGFQYHGELFEIDRIGPHKVMYKSYKSL